MPITRAQLIAENAALRTEINTLREQLLNVTSVASAVNTMQRKPMSEVTADRRAAMNEERDEAKRSRTVITF